MIIYFTKRPRKSPIRYPPTQFSLRQTPWHANYLLTPNPTRLFSFLGFSLLDFSRGEGGVVGGFQLFASRGWGSNSRGAPHGDL